MRVACHGQSVKELLHAFEGSSGIGKRAEDDESSTESKGSSDGETEEGDTDAKAENDTEADGKALEDVVSMLDDESDGEATRDLQKNGGPGAETKVQERSCGAVTKHFEQDWKSGRDERPR